MSKKKPTSPQKLTIEYAGIVALLIDKDSKGKIRAEALLVDVGKTKGLTPLGKEVWRTPHYAALTLDATKFVTGAVPNVVTTLPGSDDTEKSTWNLKGCTVAITSDRDPTALKLNYKPLADASLSAAPPASVANLAYLADIASITQVKALNAKAPISARVMNIRGQVDAHATRVTTDYAFTFCDGAKPLKPMQRILATRFRQTIEFDETATITLKKPLAKDKIIKVGLRDDGFVTTTAVISNMCPCPDDGAQDHFYSYYDLLSNPQSYPTIADSPRQQGTDPAVDPEHCVVCLIKLA